MKFLRKYALAIALLVPFLGIGGGLAWSQAGQGILTSLSASYLVPIQTTGALNTAATLATLKTFIQSGGSAGAGVFTSVTANSIAGGDSSLGIDGQAAAQGGAIPITGGASSTTGNAGGAVSVTGGNPGATGIGGAGSLVGGIGGATSGAGGAVSVAGGAGTAGNAAGGAASLVGGAGQGSSAGGAVAITGGAAGATGAGGTVAITAGALTAGNGADVTVTASAGAGSTNAGGSVNLVPGAAVSTGIPGTIKVNGNSNLMCSNFAPLGAPAAATDTAFYIATRPLFLVSVSEVHAIAAGGASALQVTKDSSTNAPGAGTDLLTNNTNTGFDLNATANTVQTGTITATVATKTFAVGDRLSVDFAQAIQSSSGITVTACFAPL